MGENILKVALRATPDCLSADELDRVLANEAEGNFHLAQCSRCQAELAMLRSFKSDAPLPGEGAAVAWITSRLENSLPTSGNRRQPVVGNSWRRQVRQIRAQIFALKRSRILVPVAAVAVLAATFIVWEQNRREPVLQANLGSESILRSEEVQTLRPIGDLQAAPPVMEWKSFSGALKYKVEVMEVDHSVIWSGETSYTSVTIPNAVRNMLLPGKPLLWQVTAQDMTGKKLASSQVQRFAVIH